MANQPRPQTHEFAHEYLHRAPAQIVDHDRILYDEIMQDSFDGDHWGEGYDSEVREGWTDSENEGEDGDTASEKERIVTPLRPTNLYPSAGQMRAEEEADDRLREAEEMMRTMDAGAYWKHGGEAVQPIEVGQGWREVSTRTSVASLAAALDKNSQLGQKVSNCPVSDEFGS